MTFDFFRLQLLLATFAGWVKGHQARVIDYLVEENRVLMEQGGTTNSIDRRPATAVTSSSVNALAACCGTTTVPRPDGHEDITFMLRPPRRERDRSGVVRPSS